LKVADYVINQKGTLDMPNLVVVTPKGGASDLNMIPYTWICACCGKTYSGLPLDYGVLFPDYYLGWRHEL